MAGRDEHGAVLERGVEDVGFVQISVGPERDSPERLAEFGRSSRLDGERWTLLAGGDGQVREVAALLGVKVRRLPDGEFAHSNVISVLNREGELTHQVEGMGRDVTRAVEVPESIVNEGG